MVHMQPQAREGTPLWHDFDVGRLRIKGVLLKLVVVSPPPVGCPPWVREDLPLTRYRLVIEVTPKSARRLVERRGSAQPPTIPLEKDVGSSPQNDQDITDIEMRGQPLHERMQREARRLLS